MADVEILASQVSPAPLEYDIPGSQEILLKVLAANFDGSGASTPYQPAVQIIGPSGQVLRTFSLGSNVAAGASADVTWFPGGGVSPGASGGDGIQFTANGVYGPNNTGDALNVNTTAKDGQNYTAEGGGISLESDDGTGAGDSFMAAAVTGDNNGGMEFSVSGANNVGMTFRLDDSSNPMTFDTPNGSGQRITNVGGSNGIVINDDSDNQLQINQVGNGIIGINGEGDGLIWVHQSGGQPAFLSSTAGPSIPAPPGSPKRVIIAADGDGASGSVAVAINPGDSFVIYDLSNASVQHMLVNNGGVAMLNLPTSNPGGSGNLWNNGGVVNIT